MSELFLAVLNRSISAGWIVLAVLVLRLLLHKAPAWSRVALWALVAVRLVCPFSVESVLSLLPSGETISTRILTEQVPSVNTGVPLLDGVLNPILGESLAPHAGDSVNPLQVLVPVLAVLWLAGGAALLAYGVVRYAGLARKVSTAVRLRDSIYQTERVNFPFVQGFLKPKIYVPFSVDPQEAEYVIAHEQAHVRRGDHLWKLVGFLLLAVYWFHPLLWAAYGLFCRDLEFACDQRVVKDLAPSQRADYSQALLNCSGGRHKLGAVPLAFGEVGVRQRVKTILSYKKPRVWIIAGAAVVLAAAAVCLLTDPLGKDITDLDDQLQVFLDMQVAEHNRSQSREVDFSAISYDVMDIQESGGETTLYAWIYYVEYNRQDGQLEKVSASHVPTVITARKEGSQYQLVEYWTPGDGSRFQEDIQEKFPRRLWARAMDGQRSVEKQKAECQAMAEEWLQEEMKNSQWDVIPMVMVDGLYYYSTGREAASGDGAPEGEITSTVDGTQIPQENDQSNFGEGFPYRYGEEGTLQIQMNGKWMVFEHREGTGSQVRFGDRWMDSHGLSEETLEWLAWYNSLPEEEQLAVSYIPPQVYERLGLGGDGTEDADAPAAGD